ncbi:MAG: hypothetical protein AAGE88_18270 [Actinomycetota bacterium]
MATSRLFSRWQRVINLWRNDDDGLAEAYELAAEAKAAVVLLGLDPAEVAERVWGRSLNSDVAAKHERVDVLGL